MICCLGGWNKIRLQQYYTVWSDFCKTHTHTQCVYILGIKINGLYLQTTSGPVQRYTYNKLIVLYDVSVSKMQGSQTWVCIRITWRARLFQQRSQGPMPDLINKSKGRQGFIFLTCYWNMLIPLVWDYTLDTMEIVVSRVFWHTRPSTGIREGFLEETLPSHPNWFSVISEVLTKAENHFQMLTELNGNSGFTNDKIVYTK